jgi:hypothetical protein
MIQLARERRGRRLRVELRIEVDSPPQILAPGAMLRPSPASPAAAGSFSRPVTPRAPRVTCVPRPPAATRARAPARAGRPRRRRAPPRTAPCRGPRRRVEAPKMDDAAQRTRSERAGSDAGATTHVAPRAASACATSPRTLAVGRRASGPAPLRRRRPGDDPLRPCSHLGRGCGRCAAAIRRAGGDRDRASAPETREGGARAARSTSTAVSRPAPVHMGVDER